jgi:hypothetical protein
VGLTYEAARSLERISELHEKEFGKVVQKLLALTFVELGFHLAEERAVQGVDIDIIRRETGEKLSFEVKTGQGSQVPVVDKDIDGLNSRKEADQYDTYFAFLFQPHYLSEGWIIVPASKIKKGTCKAMRLVGQDDGTLSKEVNAVFPEVLERVCDDLLSCKKGSALGMLKNRYKI